MMHGRGEFRVRHSSWEAGEQSGTSPVQSDLRRSCTFPRAGMLMGGPARLGACGPARHKRHRYSWMKNKRSPIREPDMAAPQRFSVSSWLLDLSGEFEQGQ